MKRNSKGQFTKGTHWREESPIWDKNWLYNEYITNNKSMGDISKELNITEPAVRYWIRKHNIKSRGISESRQIKYWGSSGSDNPMWNKKGELNPNWKGGISAERQSFYENQEWKKVCSFIWKRDNATCQRCGLEKRNNKDHPFHVHHIVSFKIVEKRSDESNLVLLCETCHHWVHSKLNVNKEYLI